MHKCRVSHSSPNGNGFRFAGCDDARPRLVNKKEGARVSSNVKQEFESAIEQHTCASRKESDEICFDE